jgi:hypothetical protein
MAKITLQPETVQVIEQVLNKGYLAEVKIEKGKPEVIEIRRKKVTNTTE